jgi:hypothetical protein
VSGRLKGPRRWTFSRTREKLCVHMSNENIEYDGEACPVQVEGRHRYPDVVSLVRKLGPLAVEEFLNGLVPHFAALAVNDPESPNRLSMYLHDSAVSALTLLSIGGIDGLQKAEEVAQASEPLSIVEVQKRFDALAS